MKRLAISLCALLGLVGVVTAQTERPRPVVLCTQIAATPAARTQGLSGQESLSANGGMLFVSGEPRLKSFWMKEMNFPIDILWFQDRRLEHEARNISPDTWPQTFGPQQGTTMVLETVPGVLQSNYEWRLVLIPVKALQSRICNSEELLVLAI